MNEPYWKSRIVSLDSKDRVVKLFGFSRPKRSRIAQPPNVGVAFGDGWPELMTGGFKTIRRFPRFREVALVGAIACALSCTSDDQSTGPNSGPVSDSRREALQSQGSLSTPNGGQNGARRSRAIVDLAVLPDTISLTEGSAASFTASAKLSDGSTTKPSVIWSATGGTVDSNGQYTAGQTPGAFQVIATESAGSLADTAMVNVTATPPVSSAPPPGGQTFFSADGESGTVAPPFVSWGVYRGGSGLLPVTSTAKAKNGSRSFEFETTDPSVSPYSTSALATKTPQTTMGAPGRYGTGYYSYWVYLDAGYDFAAWNVMSNFFAMSPHPNPIAHMGLSVRNGVRQVYITMKNAQERGWAVPTVPGYAIGNAEYFMTASSPAGIKAFPKNQWVHICIYYKFARSNGEIAIWQDGTLIMDITGAAINTRDGTEADNPETNNDMMVSVGTYHGPNADAVRRLFIDDFKVTDYRTLP